jgi:hypothetical protein
MSPQLCRFSDAGNDDLTTRPAAGVRKAPRHEIAVTGRAAVVPLALWGFADGARVEGRAICDGYAARTGIQLKRYGTNIAKWGFHVLSHL